MALDSSLSFGLRRSSPHSLPVILRLCQLLHRFVKRFTNSHTLISFLGLVQTLQFFVIMLLVIQCSIGPLHFFFLFKHAKEIGVLEEEDAHCIEKRRNVTYINFADVLNRLNATDTQAKPDGAGLKV